MGLCVYQAADAHAVSVHQGLLKLDPLATLQLEKLLRHPSPLGVHFLHELGPLRRDGKQVGVVVGTDQVFVSLGGRPIEHLVKHRNERAQVVCKRLEPALH